MTYLISMNQFLILKVQIIILQAHNLLPKNFGERQILKFNIFQILEK